jgi:hypothetical protein
MRVTYNFKPNDHKMSTYVMGKMMEIARAANAKVVGSPQVRNNFDTNVYGSSHHTGGAIMGTDPRTSAIVFLPGQASIACRWQRLSSVGACATSGVGSAHRCPPE